MSYGWDPARQVDVVFLCLGLGFLAGFLRDVLKSIRLLFSDKTAVVFVEDVLFFLLWGAMSFLLSLAVCAGRMRGYMFVCEGIGFLVWYRFPGILSKKTLAKCLSVRNRYLTEKLPALGKAILWPVLAKRMALYRKNYEKKQTKSKVDHNKFKKMKKRLAFLKKINYNKNVIQ